MSDDVNIPTYIGRAPCGCVRFATVDLPEHAKDNAKEIAKVVRLGWTIERVTVGWIREHGFGDCEVCKPPKKHKDVTQEALPQ